MEDAAITGERQPEELATALARMARDLLAQESLQDTLGLREVARRLAQTGEALGVGLNDAG